MRHLHVLLGMTLLGFLRRWRAPHFVEDFGGEPPSMVVELPGEVGRYEGQEVRRARIGNTHPWNRYFNRPLEYRAANLQDIAGFLRACKYRRDQETRSRRDYWEPPDEFERRRTGDCEDHALWAWRQLCDLGYRARFVLGQRHAWVHILTDARCYLVEATHKRGPAPRVRRYTPFWSVERVDAKSFRYFAHYRDTTSTD
jgi:hypothetical protein